MTWTQVLQKAAVDAAFRAEVAKVVHTMHGSRSKNFCPQDVLGETAVGYRMVLKLLFMSSADFMALEGVSPSELGMKEVMLNNELGHPVSGLILKDPAHPHRSLEVYSGVQSLVAEQLLDEKEMLRRDQGLEMHEWQKVEVEKKLPKAMKVPGEAWSLDGLRTFVDTKKAELEQARIQRDNEAAALAPIAPAVHEVVPVAPLQGLSPGNNDDESDSGGEVGLLNFSVGNTKPNMGKGKDKGASKSKKNGKGKPASPKKLPKRSHHVLGPATRRSLTMAKAVALPNPSAPASAQIAPANQPQAEVARPQTQEEKGKEAVPIIKQPSAMPKPVPPLPAADPAPDSEGRAAAEASQSVQKRARLSTSFQGPPSIKRQPASERSSPRGSVEEAVKNAKEKKDALDLIAVLAGASPGQDVYQARRAAARLEQVDAYNPEVLLLRAQIDLAKQAEALQNVSALSKEDRDKHILSLQEYGVEWPTAMQASILALTFKDQVKERMQAKSTILL